MTELAVGPTAALEESCWDRASDTPRREAVTCLHMAAQYNLRRLQTYRQWEDHGDRIRLHAEESGVFLRFEDVSYFNSVYTAEESFANRLREVEDFFIGSPHACTLVGPPLKHWDRMADAGIDRDWRLGARYVWVHGLLESMPIPAPSGEFEIRPPSTDERESFLKSYLEIFEAAPDRHAAAIRNMRHLFKWPDLHFLFAFREGRPAGIAMLLQVGSAALYCAGGVMPAVQNQGCHAALLGARARLARELGCREVYSWTYADGRSERNMKQAGLEAVGVTQTWSFQPQR